MTLDYTIHGQVNILIFNYANQIIIAFDKAEPKRDVTKSNADANDLFKVNKDHERLLLEKATEFHNLVAMTLYATK
jgi:hypothetical protein